jgi:outer membrane putative beta-barrel porin/alpha-amylase
VWADPQAEGVAENKEINNGEDVTRPLSRFDVRFLYQNTNKPNNDSYIIKLRGERPLDLGKGWKLGTRLDLPFYVTNVMSEDNPAGNYQLGLGDVLIQGLIINSPTPRFSWTLGSQFIFPTATKEEMGSGQYQILPTAGARYLLPEISHGSWFTMALRYDIGFDVDEGQSRKNELQLAPSVNFEFPKGWYLTTYPDTNIKINLGNEKKGRLFLPLDFLVGNLITRRITASLETAVPIINNYQVYNLQLQARISFFFTPLIK